MNMMLPASEMNPVERALANYTELEQALAEAEAKNLNLSIENGSLLAEVFMLREALGRADADRVRLQAVASTLSGELMSIRDVIEGSLRRALQCGITAKPTETPRHDTQKAVEEALTQKTAEQPEEPKTDPEPPQGRQNPSGISNVWP